MSVITATKVQSNHRLAQLPKYFPTCYLSVESAIYDRMGELCKEYNGGYWEFVKLSNGGFFMYPSTQMPYKLVNADNYNEATFSPQGAGMVVCLLVYSALAFGFPRDAERLSNCYHALRDYALDSAERGQIASLID